jgi:hypothetical protein
LMSNDLGRGVGVFTLNLVRLGASGALLAGLAWTGRASST